MNRISTILLTTTLWGLVLLVIFPLDIFTVILFVILINAMILLIVAWKRKKEAALSKEDLALQKNFMSQMFFQGKDSSYFIPNIIGIVGIIIILESLLLSFILSLMGMQTGLYSIAFAGFNISIGAILLFFSNFIEGRFRIRTHKGIPHKYFFLEGTPARLVNFGFIVLISLFIYFAILPLL